MSEIDDLSPRMSEVLSEETPLLDRQLLLDTVTAFIDRSEQFRDLAAQFGSPLYVIEEGQLIRRARKFVDSFHSRGLDINAFFAVKCNNHPAIARTLAQAGMGLDVSSGGELGMALDCGAERIIFSGPGKTEAEHELAIVHRDQVTVLIDSFAELSKLAEAASRAKTSVRCGVRVCVDDRGLWRKFGISLGRLSEFIAKAESLPSIKLAGIQFHTSWNMSPSNQTAFIARLGSTLIELDSALRSRIEFIDIGGGYWPEHGEWLHRSTTPEGATNAAIGGHDLPTLDHRCVPSVPIDRFADQIGRAFEDHIFPHTKCAVYAEPGRWICHPCAHYLVTALDRKADDIVIADGGTNAIGWERFESDYFPVINLTHPALTEKLCYVFGSLCTPHDVWGYSYFGSEIAAGDILLVPYQGAYTYSLRQRFIKPIPPSVLLKRDGSTEVVSVD